MLLPVPSSHLGTKPKGPQYHDLNQEAGDWMKLSIPAVNHNPIFKKALQKVIYPYPISRQ